MVTPIPKEDLDVELLRLSDVLNKSPSKRDMADHGKYSVGPYKRQYGAWNKAKLAVELSIDTSYPYQYRTDAIPLIKSSSTIRKGTNWEAQREKAIERDGGVCSASGCSVTNEEHNEKYGKDLCVHHQIPRRRFALYSCATIEESNALSNLRTLCVACHPSYEHSDHYRCRSVHKQLNPYSFYIKDVLQEGSCSIEPGNTVAVEFDDGRNRSGYPETEEFSRYDEEFDPVFTLRKVQDGESASENTVTRKVEERTGTPVGIPPKFITRDTTPSLGLNEDNYNSAENPLLFEPSVREDSITFVPLTYESETPYPRPKPPTREELRQNEPDNLGDGYVEGAPISAAIIRDVIEYDDMSADKTAEVLLAVEESADREKMKEQGLFDTDYSPLHPPAVGDHELADAFPVVDFIDPVVWENAIIPGIAERFDNVDVEMLQKIIPYIHVGQAKQFVNARHSVEHRRFTREGLSAIVTLNPSGW